MKFAVSARAVAGPTAYRFAKVGFVLLFVFAVTNTASAATEPTTPTPSVASSTTTVLDKNSPNVSDTDDEHQQPADPTIGSGIDQLIHESLDEILAAMKEFHSRGTPGRPFVTLTYAQSIDGKIALLLDRTARGASPRTAGAAATSSNFAISGHGSLRLTHALRSVHDAIVVGGNTLAVDNPRLGNRLWKTTGASDSWSDRCGSGHQPRPVVLDTHLRSVRALGAAMRAERPIVCCSKGAYDRAVREGFRCDAGLGERSTRGGGGGGPGDERVAGKTGGPVPSSVTLLPCKTRAIGGRGEDPRIVLDLPDVLSALYHRYGIHSVMVEGGASVITQFVTGTRDKEGGENHPSEEDRFGLVDLLCVTISPKLLGSSGLDSILSPQPATPPRRGPGPLRCITLGEDCVLFSSCR